MNVIVDKTIWSLALRRRRPADADQKLIEELNELIRELRVLLIGPVRQEILSGIPELRSFAVAERALSAFDDLVIEPEDYVEAARMYNICRKAGVQGSHTDYLICSVASRHGAGIFTTDKDFVSYSRHLEVRLHQPR